jgi:hypothetical protein
MNLINKISKEELALALECGCAEGNTLMVSKAKFNLILVPTNRVTSKLTQGYVEAMSENTLLAVLGSEDFSDNGQAEADKVIAWMQAQN